MSDARIDRLFELLPVVYRQRDEESNHALRDLLRIIAEQVNVIEDDIARLYENWFIETCEEWVVPYIGDLVGYGDASTAPRRAIANHLRDLRRRGTLALLEELANDVGGFGAHATEYYTLLGRLQSLNHLNARGGLADLRNADAFDRIDGPFDAFARTVDSRLISGSQSTGRHNIPSIGVWLWRLRAFPVTRTSAYFVQRGGGYFFYSFHATGHDAPIYTKAAREPDLAGISNELQVPAPIRRRALAKHTSDYYGIGKSFAIWIDSRDHLVPASDIIAADLSNWEYRPPDGKVAVDPKLGRIAVAREPENVWVSYHYGFTDDVGAHESPRVLRQPRAVKKEHVYRVGTGETLTTITAALDQWKNDAPDHAVIEISDSGVYSEMFEIELASEHTLQIRAANRCRPVLRVPDYHHGRGEALGIILNEHARFTLDGVMVIGRPLRVEGVGETPVDARLVIRRCTLVPGWSLHPNCDPAAPDESSIDIRNLKGRVTIDRSILGTISVMDETNESEPLRIAIRDSIVDATSNDREAVVGPGASYAWATLHIERCTFFGTIETHAIELAENSIFNGLVHVVRRQLGCMRFCWVPPRSRTPKRYHCQPDLVDPKGTNAEERRRVEPTFGSMRFGSAHYAQLDFDCADEITRGADDESEMGAFHDTFLAQRIDSLRARLDHATAAGMESGILYADQEENHAR